jgi:hypothetical protein
LSISDQKVNSIWRFVPVAAFFSGPLCAATLISGASASDAAWRHQCCH